MVHASSRKGSLLEVRHGQNTVDEQAQAAADRRLAAGPEGDWCQDLRVTERILRRLSALAPTLFAPHQEGVDRDRLQQPYARMKVQFQHLGQVLEQVLDHDHR